MSHDRFGRHDHMDVDDFEELLADMPHDERWELIGGRVVRMMAGAQWQHNVIIQNLAAALRQRSGCKEASVAHSARPSS